MMSYEMREIRIYVDREIERLGSLNPDSPDSSAYQDGQISALLRLKSRFLLTDDEWIDARRARLETFG